MKKIILTLFITTTMAALLPAQTRVIAHRGFWDTDGSAQNSIAALEKADSIGCYGSEFDVWIAADNELVVNHDAHYKNQEIMNTPSTDLITLELKNGEKMPTLREYLLRGKELKTQLILELKPHKNDERETLAVRKIVEMVKELGLQSRVEYISFSKHAVKELILVAPQGTPVYYLDGDLSPVQLKEMGCSGPDYHLNVFKRNPEWIQQCHDLGMKVNCWTVNKEKDMEWLIERKVDFITTDKPTLLQNTLNKNGVTSK